MRKYLLKKDPIDLRDKVFRSTRFQSPEHLPKDVDLRAQFMECADQGQLGSCTGNGIGAFLEHVYGYTDVAQRIARLFIYYHERLMENTVNEDAGAIIRDGMQVIQKIGAPFETDCPYDISKFTQAPSAKAEADAAQHKITEYHRVNDLNGLKAALAEGLPVVIGVTVYESFESQQVAETGKVPNPKRGEQVLGGHCMLAVGYKDTGKTGRSGYVIVRNSWGTGWGDNGYCYIPYTVFNKIIQDMWTGTQVK
jgi:C1A family cysteine protease